MIQCDIQVGDRISCNGDVGTVCYVGEVKNFTGKWLGIDWDKELRGKHNGSVDGYVYFTTSYPTSGSFVRPQKVSRGVSLIEAFKNKYGLEQNYDTSGQIANDLVALKLQMNSPSMEVVGLQSLSKKISDFRNLTVVSLRGLMINASDGPSKLSEVCPNIVDLNLSANLLNKWSNFISICYGLKNLKFLDISDNNLSELDSIPNCQTLITLSTLICNKTHIHDVHLNLIQRLFPNLEELRATYNNIQVADPTVKFSQLKHLNLEGNKLVWSNVLHLNACENLEMLMLNDCGITEIYFDGGENLSKTEQFKWLKNLSISSNLISDWKCVDELDKLARLEKLHLKDNPVLFNDVHGLKEAFQVTVARIGDIKILNGCTIEDRKGDEVDYWKKYGLEWLKCKNEEKAKADFLSKHRRYLVLLEKFGEMEAVFQSGNSCATQFTEVVFKQQSTDKTFTKKLPNNMPVQRIKKMVEKLFHLESIPQLSLTSDDPYWRYPLDDDLQDLRFYSINNGDVLLVE